MLDVNMFSGYMVLRCASPVAFHFSLLPSFLPLSPLIPFLSQVGYLLGSGILCTCATRKQKEAGPEAQRPACDAHCLRLGILVVAMMTR